MEFQRIPPLRFYISHAFIGDVSNINGEIYRITSAVDGASRILCEIGCERVNVNTLEEHWRAFSPFFFLLREMESRWSVRAKIFRGKLTAFGTFARLRGGNSSEGKSLKKKLHDKSSYRNVAYLCCVLFFDPLD